MKSPIIQGFLKKDYEVLLLDDPVDEFCFQHLSEFEKKKLVNVARGEIKLPEDDESARKKLRKVKEIYKKLTDWWKKIIPALETVSVSSRLIDEPCIAVASESGPSPRME